MTTDAPPLIPYEYFPHLIEAIAAEADYKTKLRLRATCGALRKYVDKLLLQGIVDIGDHPCGALYISPFKGDGYPFFSLDADLPAQRQFFTGRKLTLRDIGADPRLNLLFSESPAICVSHHTRVCNFQLLREHAGSYLGLHLDWKCSCGDGGLSPSFRHVAEHVNVHLHVDDLYLSDRTAPPTGTIALEKGDNTRCHMLQNALNSGVRSAVVIVGAPIAEASLELLPAYVFPNAPKIDLDARFRIAVTLPELSEDAAALQAKTKQAFARHLRIPEGSVRIYSGYEEPSSA